MVECQERGTPHVHFLLWTVKSLIELVAQNNSADQEKVTVSCSAAHQDAGLRELVRVHQQQKHNKDYCMGKEADGIESWRFGVTDQNNG